MTRCMWCLDQPATVFTPEVALCRPCKCELERQEAEDNLIDNGPTCGTCGSVLNGSGVCAECVVRCVTEAHRAMGRAS